MVGSPENEGTETMTSACTRRLDTIGVHVTSHRGAGECSDVEGVSRLQFLCRISNATAFPGQSQLANKIWGGRGTHAERFIKLLRNMDLDDFDGDFPTLKF